MSEGAEELAVGADEHAAGLGWGALLRRNRPFSYLFVATAGSATGTYLAALVLAYDINRLTGSGQWIGALLVADFLPIVLIGLTLGPLVDRLPRRKLMIGADLVRALVFAALPFVDSPAAIVALAGLSGIATGFFRPAVWAGLPNLVPEQERESATALFSTTENVAWVAGPIAAVALAAFGTSTAYWANAVSFVISALLIMRIPSRRMQTSAPLTRGHWRDVRDGMSLVLAARPLRTVLLAWSLAAIASASVNIGEVKLASDVFDTGIAGYAALVVSTGLGLVAGSYLAGRGLGSMGMSRLYWGSLLTMAFGFGAGAVAPWLALACVLAAIGAVGNGSAIVCNQVLVQRGAEDAMRGRVLAVLMSVYYACLALGMGVAGVLTDALGPREVWGIAGGVYALAATVAFVMTRTAQSDATSAHVGTSGQSRVERLLGEIDATREREQAREATALPYVPRKRTSA
ncbi:MAG: MFS transporter [Gaiellales bacterium]